MNEKKLVDKRIIGEVFKDKVKRYENLHDREFDEVDVKLVSKDFCVTDVNLAIQKTREECEKEKDFLHDEIFKMHQKDNERVIKLGKLKESHKKEKTRIREDIEKLKPLSSWNYNQRYSYNRAIDDVLEVLKDRQSVKTDSEKKT